MRLSQRLAVIALLVLSPVPIASAQDDEVDLADEEARGLFDAGRSAYLDGRYEDALGHFQRAYELSHRPQLLFNIGSAADRARQDDLAIRSFRAYLDEVPDAPNRAQAEARIQAISSSLARHTPDSATTAGADPLPFVVLGLGVAVAITGGVVLGLGAVDADTIQNPADGTRWAEVASTWERGNALLTAGAVLLPVGLAMLTAGIGWAVAVPSGGSSEAVTLRIGPLHVGVEGRL